MIMIGVAFIVVLLVFGIIGLLAELIFKIFKIQEGFEDNMLVLVPLCLIILTIII